MSRQGLTWKIFLLIACNDAANAFAQLFMKKGLTAPATALTGFQTVTDFFAGNIGSPLMWLGIAIYALSFFIWIIVLSRIELSVAMPIASFDYAVIPVLAAVFLKESVSPLRWAATLAIAVGIYFVSKSESPVPAGGKAL